VTFKTFPNKPDPLLLDSAGRGDFEPFLEMLDDTGKMFVRIVATDDSCAAIPSKPPRIRLIADDGAQTPLVMAPDLVDIFSDQNMPVASASLNAEEASVFLIVIIVTQPGSIWQMEITNTNPERRSFTCTVASSLDESRQPWIDMPANVDFGSVRHGDSETKKVPVINRGSKELSINVGPKLENLQFGKLQFGPTLLPHKIVIQAQECGNFEMRFQPNGNFFIPPPGRYWRPKSL
jgi:hypothetical protein